MHKTTKIAATVLALMGMVGLAAAPALAASGTTTAVGRVDYFPGTLSIWVPGNSTDYVAKTSGTPTGCNSSNVSLDTLKLYQSMATAALLSGKTLTIYYYTCSDNVNYIYELLINAS